MGEEVWKNIFCMVFWRISLKRGTSYNSAFYSKGIIQNYIIFSEITVYCFKDNINIWVSHIYISLKKKKNTKGLCYTAHRAWWQRCTQSLPSKNLKHTLRTPSYHNKDLCFGFSWAHHPSSTWKIFINMMWISISSFILKVSII